MLIHTMNMALYMVHKHQVRCTEIELRNFFFLKFLFDIHIKIWLNLNLHIKILHNEVKYFLADITLYSRNSNTKSLVKNKRIFMILIKITTYVYFIILNKIMVLWSAFLQTDNFYLIKYGSWNS